MTMSSSIMIKRKTKIYFTILLSVWIFCLILMWQTAQEYEITQNGLNSSLAGRWFERRPINRLEPVLTHRQELWRGILEWCESRGNPNAINPKDKDGTPSLGGFQFKPRTFEHYRTKYKLPSADVMNYQMQFTIVGYMINDPDVNFEQEFPDCVRRYGWPPTK